MPANSNKTSSLLLTVTLVTLAAFTIPKVKDVLVTTQAPMPKPVSVFS